ncbi:hypothetical protein EVAR_78562_1 [Eumeta japonica]|uniref:Uncharacterized protein n=1 Tax=Eumeta variegata TaxID=151549 RepID=A0A4C1W7K1_EUMVA|nr:hypothetical protein EVAR_78562_1 [Eumeta japonica]
MLRKWSLIVEKARRRSLIHSGGRIKARGELEAYDYRHKTKNQIKKLEEYMRYTSAGAKAEPSVCRRRRVAVPHKGISVTQIPDKLRSEDKDLVDAANAC